MTSTIRSLHYAALGLLAVVSLASAQVDVAVSGRIPVSVPPFSGAGGPEAAKIVQADLNRTLLIDAKGSGGERYTASATLSGGALNGQLLEGGTALLAKAYTGDARHAAHEFADDITLALTKTKGFATSRLACVTAAGGKKEIGLSDIDGFNAVRLTDDHTISARPKWSADGSAIAYTSYKSGYPDAYVIHLGSRQRTRVAFFPGINTGPAFSPDGGRLALTLSKDGNPQIYTIPAGGGGATRLTHGHGTETSPSWSPDGSRIVYDSDERGSVQLYTIPAGGGEPTRLSTGVSYSAEPDWSPDGTKIAFTGRVAGQFQVGVYDLATGQASILTTGGGQDPSWTRNSRHLVYSRGGSLYVLDTRTRQTARLDNNLTQASEPAVSR